MKGLLESIAFCLAPKNKGAVLATITKRLKLADASVAEDGYQDVINGVERKPYPTIEGLRNIQRLMKIRNPSLEKLKVEDLIDDRILRRLDESGYIDQLAKTIRANSVVHKRSRRIEGACSSNAYERTVLSICETVIGAAGRRRTRFGARAEKGMRKSD